MLVFQVTDAQDLYWVKVIRYLLPPIQVVIKSPPSTEDAFADGDKLDSNNMEATLKGVVVLRNVAANRETIENMRFKKGEIMDEICFLPFKLLVNKT